MIRKLIVTADDLGAHEAINRGILEAHEEGIVTSASIVPCGRAFDHACRLVEKRRKLDVGIHLTLVEERPLLGPDEIKTLAPKRVLPKTYRQLFMGIVKGRINLSDIEKELDAQIQRVVKAGLTVSHLDSHQHTHLFPPLRAMFFRLAAHYEVKYVRASSRIVPGRTKFSLLLAPLARGLQRAARKRGIRTADTLWLPSPSGHLTGRQITEGIPKLPEGVTELVVHPGADQKVLEREYPDWGFKWQQELAALKATDVRDTLWLPSPSGHLTGRQIAEGIPKLPEGVTELVVHPGADQKVLEREYPDWGFKWQQELAALKATDVRDTLFRQNVQLTRYSELL